MKANEGELMICQGNIKQIWTKYKGNMKEVCKKMKQTCKKHEGNM